MTLNAQQSNSVFTEDSSTMKAGRDKGKYPDNWGTAWLKLDSSGPHKYLFNDKDQQVIIIEIAQLRSRYYNIIDLYLDTFKLAQERLAASIQIRASLLQHEYPDDEAPDMEDAADMFEQTGIAEMSRAMMKIAAANHELVLISQGIKDHKRRLKNYRPYTSHVSL